MCFSATASFVASGGLAVIGVASLQLATKQQRAIAVIPLLFAIQQAFEGVQWMSGGVGCVSGVAAYGFVIFALLIWPLYIPFTVYVLDKTRRSLLIWPLGIGIAVALYYLVLLVMSPIQVHILGHSIYYKLNMLYGAFTGIFYSAAVCGALFLSSQRAFHWFGIATFISVIITTIFFVETFASVWCFFSAILSSLIFFYVRNSRR